jgi:hypothetical protein
MPYRQDLRRRFTRSGLFGRRGAGRRSAVLGAAVALAAALALSMAAGPAQAEGGDWSDVSTAGTDFWVAFDINYVYDADNLDDRRRSLRLYAAGPAGAVGEVTVPGLGFRTAFRIGDTGVAAVDLPITAMVGVDERVGVGQRIEDKAVHVTASEPVTVYGLNRRPQSTDAYTSYPTSAAGTRYRAVAYPSLSGGSLLSVVPALRQTAVHVEPVVQGVAQAPFDVVVDVGQVFEWEVPDDLTGTVVTADHPVSVFAGARCANVPTVIAACDHLVEQMAPTNTWGRTFVTHPLVGRSEDTLRVVADEAAVVDIVSTDGSRSVTLRAGEFHEFLAGQPMTITASAPIAVAQFSNGSNFDNTDADPFMVMIQPQEQGFTESVFAAPTEGFANNYVNITAPTDAVGEVLLDGVPVPAAEWTAIPGSGFSGVGLRVAPGIHRVTAPAFAQSIVYGFDTYDSYGYPGGGRLARVADIANVTLTPAEVRGAVGDELCSTVLVTDGDDAPVVGANLVVALSGDLSQNDVAVTDAAGQAVVCATLDDVGAVAATVSAGNQSATAAWTWAVRQFAQAVFVDADAAEAAVEPRPGAVTTYTGPAGAPVGFDRAAAEAAAPDGYVVIRIDNRDVFDDDPATTETITVYLAHAHELSQFLVTRTVRYAGAGDLTPADVPQTAVWTLDRDLITGVTSHVATEGYAALRSPEVAGHLADLAEVPATTVPPATAVRPADHLVTVTYTPLSPAPDTGASDTILVLAQAAGLMLVLGGGLLLASSGSARRLGRA